MEIRGYNMKSLNKIIEESNSIVFFGGAGVSTESGIPDFRGKNGLYQEEVPVEVILSHSFYVSYREEFHAFYLRNLVHPDACPNDAHKALAYLEELGKLKAVITQNIDGLHQMAGSQKVLELHGSIHRNTCLSCGKKYTLNSILTGHRDFICTCGGIVKPDVVLYEEPLDNDVFEEAISAVKACDTFIVGGTSLSVTPASTLLRYFHGKHLILINQTPTAYDHLATMVIHDSIGSALKDWIK